ncbi:hypothetical protein [Halomonas sp. H5]|uniref:hypothetical protein n=1 Tax=Halomonas sp. H5 TaxID=3423910 RepID=UPI003D361A1E
MEVDMTSRMLAWLKRGEEFYLFTLVITAVLLNFFSFEVSQPWKWAGFSLQLLGALLSIYVVYLSYNRNNDTPFLKEAMSYLKDFPVFRKKTRRMSPAHTVIAFKQHVIDSSELEFKKNRRGRLAIAQQSNGTPGKVNK